MQAKGASSPLTHQLTEREYKMSQAISTFELGMTIVTTDSIEMTIEQLEMKEAREAQGPLDLRAQDRYVLEGERAMLNSDLNDENWAASESNVGTTERPDIRREFTDSVTNFVDRMPNTMFLGKHMVEIHDSIEAHSAWANSLLLRRYETLCLPCALVYNKNLVICPNCEL